MPEGRPERFITSSPKTGPELSSIVESTSTVGAVTRFSGCIPPPYPDHRDRADSWTPGSGIPSLRTEPESEVVTVRKPSETNVIEYDEAGTAEVLTARTRPLPAAGPGEVTVEVICAGISHIDGFIRSGREAAWESEPFPRRSGSDFAGIVVDSSDPRFARGSDVVGHVRSGAQASYLTVPAAALVKKPKSVSWETAGGAYLAGVTALDTLDDLRIGAGDTVVISAAAGGVGSIEAQLACHRGATVIGTCGERNFDYLRQLKIIPVKYGEGIADRIRAAAPGGVTAFIDNFGQDGHELARALGVPESRYRSSEDRREVELRLLQDDSE